MGMRMPTIPTVQGLADQVVVAMISLIIKRWSKGPVDTAVAINGRGRPILRKEYRGQTSSPYSGVKGKDLNKWIANKPYPNGNPLE